MRGPAALTLLSFCTMQVGPHVCVLKTHVDIFDQWDDAIVQQLQALAEKHGAHTEHREACAGWAPLLLFFRHGAARAVVVITRHTPLVASLITPNVPYLVCQHTHFCPLRPHGGDDSDPNDDST